MCGWQSAIVALTLVACAVALLAAAAPASATDTTQRTPAEIQARWEQLKPTYVGSPYLVAPSLVAPYTTGTLTPGFLQDGLNSINYVRYLAGMPDDVTLDPTYTDWAQHGAVLIAVGEFAHWQPKPADMTQEFYDIAVKATSSSNLGSGYSSLWAFNFSCMDDEGGNMDRVGHRRWLLNPPLQKTGMGIAKWRTDTWVFDWSRSDPVTYDAVKWPCAGPFPVERFRPWVPWSITLNPALYSWTTGNEGHTVTLRRQRDGKLWTFTSADTDLYGEYFNFNTGGYGIANCFIFRPDPVSLGAYLTGDVFEVSLTGGIFNKSDGTPATVSYTTTFVSEVAAAGQLSSVTTDECNPSLSGTTVVWDDSRNGNRDIYAYDLTTETERRLTTNAADQDYPAIDGTRVVYRDRRNGNLDIYLYDLTTGSERRLTTDPRDQDEPAICGDHVVYSDDRNGNLDIYLYDLLSGTERRLTTNAANQLQPAIHDTRVVYTDERNGHADIYLYDLKSGVERRVTTTLANQTDPDVWGDSVVYEDDHSVEDVSNIHRYNLATGTETCLACTGGQSRAPDIQETSVVWEEDYYDRSDIYCFDLVTKTTQVLTNDMSVQRLPAVSGASVVYEDYRNGNADIYLKTSPRTVSTPIAPLTFYHSKPKTIYGYLTPRHEAGTASVELYLERKDATGTWVPKGTVAATVSDHLTYSKYEAPVTFVSTGSWRVRACLPADDQHEAVWSTGYDYITVKDVIVGTPVAPLVMYKDVKKTIYGSLKPWHTAGTYPVRIYRWKRAADGTWVSYGYVKAVAYNYLTYSRYSRSMAIPSRGKWRIRAYHPECPLHRARWSADYDYITVL